MSRALFALFLAVLTTVTVGLATAAPRSHQMLSIDIRGATPRLERLERYVDSAPVTVRVAAPKARGVTIVGTSPAGSPLHVALVRGADGVFTGTMMLGTPGTWTLAADAMMLGADAMTESFTVLVATGVSRIDTTLLFALAALSIGGGVGLIVLTKRRTGMRDAA